MLTEQHEIARAPATTLTWRPFWIGGSVGALMAIFWSYRVADDVIGQNLASGMLGQDAESMPLATVGSVLTFALVSGMAGSFTACNIAAFSAVAPITSADAGRRSALVNVSRSMGWVMVGATAVAAPYGALASVVGSNMPQLSTATIGAGLPVRLVHASVVFGILGLIMVYLALVVGGKLKAPNRFDSLSSRAQMLGIGSLIGAFLIGRPFPMFMKLYHDAADQHNPFLGALSFTLQSIGNVVFLGVVVAAVVVGGGGRLQRWMNRRPLRAKSLTAGAFAGSGTFLVLYWVVRLPAMFGYGWFPVMPWNAT